MDGTAPVVVKVLTRCCLGYFLRRFAWVFTLAHAFLAIAGLLVLLATFPYVPLLHLLASIPDALLLALPVSLSLSILIAGVMFVGDVGRRQGWLWLQLGGGRLRQVLWPIHLVAFLASLLLLWLNTEVVPHALYRARFVIDALEESPQTLALRLARKPQFLKGVSAGFSGSADGALANFSLWNDDDDLGSFVMVATRARLALVDEGRELEVRLEDGRYLGVDRDGELVENMRFSQLRLGLDAHRLSGLSKREILSLAYYSDRELRQLPAQAELLRGKGIALGERGRRRLQSIDTVRALRLGSAALPSLLLLLALLPAAFPGAGRRRGISFVVIGGGALLVQQAILETLAAKFGAVPFPVVAALPALEVAVVLVLCRDRFRGRRR